MLLVAHRINTLEKLSLISSSYGVEVDIRGYGTQMLLSHDPIADPKECTDLETYLKQAVARNIPFYIFNIKEAGYEEKIITLTQNLGIPKEKYFLLDVEFPYLYRATRKEGIRQIAVRYSEAEPIEAVEAQIVNGVQLLDWVWIDTNTMLPLNEVTVKKLSLFKTALVCPERWGRPEDIPVYANRLKELNMKIDIVMTSFSTIEVWEKCNIS